MSGSRRPARAPQLPLFDGRGGSAAGADWTVRVAPRSRRLSVRVYPGGRVRITVPPGTAPLAVEGFIARHRAWIDARVAEARDSGTARGEVRPDSVRLACFDEEWTVRYVEAARTGFRVPYPGQIVVRAPAADDGAAQRALRTWLVGEATRRLGAWLAREARDRGFDYARCQVRRQRTRWGSCSRSGTISLNVGLVFQPEEVVRYLFIHELCHTRHMNHSARFWRLVEAHEPDYKALDRQLLKGWRNVPAWVHG